MNKRNLFALTSIGLVGAGVYLKSRDIVARLLRLRPAQNRVQTQENVRVVMPDNITLATDLFLADIETPAPTILIRTPYGRPGSASGGFGRFIAQRFAERGYNVVVQDVRGRFDSEGEWEPYTHESGDAAATMAWIAQQPWSDGQIGLWGQSYVGYTAWAGAVSGSPYVKAIVPAITQSFLAERRHDSHQLDRTLRWLFLLDVMTNPALNRFERLRRISNIKLQNQLLAPGVMHLPIATVDEAILDQPVSFFRRWMDYPDPTDPYWQAVDFRSRVADVAAPAHFVGGWYDIFIEGQLVDYAALRAAGHTPYLTIGPWTHMDAGNQWESVRVGLDWFDTHLKGEVGRLRAKPVRLYVMGADEWRTFAAWPPAATDHTLFLHEKRRLTDTAPVASESPDRYRYDPADPTPNVGGALLSSEAGPKDNRDLEARADVLTYTTAPLTAPLESIGVPRVVLWVDSTAPSTDFFGRLTDVHPDGRSINLCDGHVRIAMTAKDRAADGSVRVEIELTPTAYRFLPGHCIRLQVSSGAHPRIARNLGTGDPEMTATLMVPAYQTVHHDATHPSELRLPIPSKG